MPEGSTAGDLSVVVTTYYRPKDLDTCLAALSALNPAPREVLAVVRRADSESTRVVARHDHAVLVPTDHVPQIAAMTDGVRAASAPLVALIDDDAVAPPDWASRIAAAFSDPEVGLFGGSDEIVGMPLPAPRFKHIAGGFTWFGRPIGNHHVGTGPARDVHFLKGVNLSFRRDLWPDDWPLLGEGIQVHWEMALCLQARARGWRIVYDPSVEVLHRPAPRRDADQRGVVADEGASRVGSYNQTYTLVRWMPMRVWATHLLVECLVGTRLEPGVLRGLINALRRTPAPRARMIVRARLKAAVQAQRDAT